MLMREEKTRPPISSTLLDVTMKLPMLTRKTMRKRENERQEKISSGRLLPRGIYMHFSDLKIRLTRLVTKTLGNRIRNSL